MNINGIDVDKIIYNGADVSKVMINGVDASLDDANALLFSSGDYVNVGNALTQITQDTKFTIEVYYKTTQAAYAGFVCSQMTGASGKGVQLGSTADGKALLRLQGESRLQVHTNAPLNDGNWKHLVVRYNGSKAWTGIVFIVDGNIVTSVPDPDSEPGDMTTTNPTYLGVRNQIETPFIGSMGDVRILIGTIPRDINIQHYKSKTIPTPYCKLFNNTVMKLNVATAHQGVSTDGTYIYTTDNTSIYKHDMDGTLIGSCYLKTGVFYPEDFCIVDGIAYVPLTNYSTTTPRLGKICKVNTATMEIIETIDLTESTHPASLAYHDDCFWMTLTEDATIRVYNSSFVQQKTYIFPVLGEQDEGALGAGYSGFEWIGNFVYGNKHGGTTRQLDVAKYDPLTDSFIAIGAFYYASAGTTQGLVYDSVNSKVYWAARGHSCQVWESDLTGGLVGYWKINEGSGDALKNSSALGVDGAIVGCSWA